MRRNRLLRCGAIGALLAVLLLSPLRPAQAQFATPTVDGSIGSNEYGDHTDGQNQQTHGSQVWYMTWDDTNLYVAVTGADLSEGAVLYLDQDPLAPINGGTDSEGTIVGQSYDNTNFAALQFRADFVTYFKNGYREYRTADGANGWSSATTNYGSYADSTSGNVREMAIPWSTLGGRPASLAWFAYLTSSDGFVYAQVPTENSGGNIGTSARYVRYYIVSNTTDGASTKPFSRNSYVFNSTSDIGDFGAVTVYDFTMNSAGRALTRASGDWTISGDLRVDSGAVSFGSTTSSATVTGNVVIGDSGIITLSSQAGGDLAVGGDWSNDGTFVCNGRQVTFEGSEAQSIGGMVATTFDYLLIDTEGNGVVTLTSDIVVKRELKINDSDAALSAGSTILTLQGDASAGPVFWNNGTFNRGTGTVLFTGGNDKHARVWGSATTTFYNVTISEIDLGTRAFGVDFYDHDTSCRAHIAGTLTLNQHTFVASEEDGSSSGCGSTCDGTPFYDDGSTLRYNNSGNFDSGAEWWPDDVDPTCGTDWGLPYNVVVENGTAVDIDMGFANGGQEPNYSAGSDKTACGSVTINSGSRLTSTVGTLRMKDDFVNNGSYTHSNGTVVLEGSGTQTLGGSNETTFYNLTLNNSSGALLGRGQRVTATLTFSSGLLTLDSYDLVLGSSAAAVAGALNASNMVVADGAGRLCKDYATTGSYTFPVGDTTDTANYSPAVLSFSSGTFNGGQACVRLTDAKHPNNSSPTHYLTRYWTVTSTGILAFSSVVTFTYVGGAEDVAGTESSIYSLQYDGGAWTQGDPVDVANDCFTMTVNNFSDFTGGNNPTTVHLATFAARPAPGGVLVAWETTSERDNLGFHLYRSFSAETLGERLNTRLIPSPWPGGDQGASYEFLDTTTLPGVTYHYTLEDVDASGGRTAHGPVVLTLWRVYLPLVVRNSP